MSENIFSEIPLRTWRWLGVNDIKAQAPAVEKVFSVADGATQKISDVNLSAGAADCANSGNS